MNNWEDMSDRQWRSGFGDGVAFVIIIELIIGVTILTTWIVLS